MAELSLSLDDFASKNKNKSRGGGKVQSRGRRNRPNRGGGGPVFERTARELRQSGRRKTPYNKASRADGRWTNDKFAEVQEEEEPERVIPFQSGFVPVQPVASRARTVPGDLRNTLNSQEAKLYVSNVEKQITEEELLQLFEGIGKIKSFALHFDKEGNSQGTATVVYANKTSSDEAISEFNGRMLDGQELLIECITSGQAAPPAETSVTIDPMQNIAAAPVFVDTFDAGGYDDQEDEGSFWGLAGGSNKRDRRRNDRFSSRNDRSSRPRRTSRPNNRNRRDRDNKKDVSEGDLDAQMEAYRAKAKKESE